MSKIIWITTATISLIISVIINFNATSVGVFLIGLLITGSIVFGTSTLIIKSIQKHKAGERKKAIILGFLSILSIVIISFKYLMFLFGGGCLTAITPAHFRTNIFTGQCDFGGSSECVSDDPWYYKADCNSDAEKIKAIENTTYYNDRLQECSGFCEKNNKKSYCEKSETRNSWSNGPADIHCSALKTCKSIICD